MQRTKYTVIVLLVLTLVNIGIYVFRDHFQYHPYASYQSLYKACDKQCYDKWDQFSRDYPAGELAEARHLTDSILGKENISTEDRVKILGNFLYQRFAGQLGNPTALVAGSSPLRQYRLLSEQKGQQLWCSNFAQIFSFFCWSQNIITRNIEIMNPGDHHVVNECYLPETANWVLVDLTTNMLLVKDEKGQLLDLPALINKPGREKLLVCRSGKDHLIDTPDTKERLPGHYYTGNNDLYYYQSMDNNKVYQTTGKFSRYLLPVSWYNILDDRRHGNFLFYLKDLMIILWLLAFFVFIAGRTKFRI